MNNQTKWQTLRSGLYWTFAPKPVMSELKTLKMKDYLLLATLSLTQILVFTFGGTYDAMSFWSMVVGVVTIFNLILVNRGRLTNYAWGTLSCFFWFFTAVYAHHIGDIASQGFYLVMQFVGIYFWQKTIEHQKDQREIVPKKITLPWIIVTVIAFIVLYGLVFWISQLFHGQQIPLDSSLLALAIVSQVLMTFGYRSQWIGWLSIDVINVVVWWQTMQSMGSSALGMFVLQILMLINAIYGTYLWFKKPSKE